MSAPGDQHDTALGHTVLQVPVPELETWVRARWEHHDPAWVSGDPRFGHAHVTVLGPFLPTPTDEDLAVVADVVASVPTFAFTAGPEVETFPDGLLHLRLDPDEGFRTLTSALHRAFPQCPPYEGRFGDVVPHLTLDHTAAGVTAAWVRRSLADLVPARCRARRVDLARYAEGDCRVLASWDLPTGS